MVPYRADGGMTMEEGILIARFREGTETAHE